MKMHSSLFVRLNLTAVAVLMALLLLVLMSPAARADVLASYQPNALAAAESALEQGEPDRALAHLRAQRAMLSHERFRDQARSIRCRAYQQQGEIARAESACESVSPFNRKTAIAASGGSAHASGI